MVNIDRFCEGDYVNVEVVKASPSKRFIILDEGKTEIGKFGEKFSFNVELDKKQKEFTPYRDAMKAMKNAWGSDSRVWIGKTGTFFVTTKGTKEVVIVIPDAPQQTRMDFSGISPPLI
jgi:hypothetical protein